MIKGHVTNAGYQNTTRGKGKIQYPSQDNNNNKAIMKSSFHLRAQAKTSNTMGGLIEGVK